MHPELEPKNPKPSYRFSGDAPPTALADLSNKRRWVAWEYAWRKGRWTKPPVNPHTGEMASVSDPSTWGTFAEALACMKRHGLAGVGLMLNGTDDDVIGVDLDHCINDAGNLTPLAAEIVGLAETYAETSPSGEGIRFFARGKLAKAIKEEAVGIEIYSTGRFLTVTGQHIPDTPTQIAEAPVAVARLIETAEAARRERKAAEAAKRPKSNASANGHAKGHVGDFFGSVNQAALAHLDDWIPVVLPAARKHSTGAWRVSSEDMGHPEFEEDFSAHPGGIWDYGPRKTFTPVDLVIERSFAPDPVAAATWLCKQMGIDPAALGWKGNGHASGAPDAPATTPDVALKEENSVPSHWDIKPWDHPVEGNEILNSLAGTLEEYSILPPHSSSAIALWIVFAHSLDAFWIAPILSIESPERRCGKSKLLDLIELLSPRGYMSGNMSVATTFRICDERKPTFVWDEIKRFITPERVELIGLLETGYRRRTAWVDRCETEGRRITTKRFSTWCPKVVAMKGSIGDIAETLEDRAIRIRMRRKLTTQAVKELRQDRIKPFTDLCRQAARWATDKMALLKEADPAVPEQLHDRARDNWRPLLAIADLAGGEWPEKAREAAKAISGSSDDEEDSGAVVLLRHCKEVFDADGRDCLTPTHLVELLCKDEEWPWKTWRHGRDPITPRAVAKLLKPFEIKSEKSGRRAYHRKSFEEAWKRYL